MKIVGVTGPSGSGKSELCKLFENKSIPYINTDNIYHQLLIPPSDCLDELVLAFGDDILHEDKTLNRKKLAVIVFTNKDSLAKLNKITHKHIIKKTKEILKAYEANGKRIVVVDAPLLFESGFDSECDITISVLADKNIRKSRIIARDNLSEAEAEKRINAQYTDDFYKGKSNYTIYNNGDRVKFETEFLKILSIIEE